MTPTTGAIAVVRSVPLRSIKAQVVITRMSVRKLLRDYGGRVFVYVDAAGRLRTSIYAPLAPPSSIVGVYTEVPRRDDLAADWAAAVAG